MLNDKEIKYSVNPNGTIYLIPNTAGPKVYGKNMLLDAEYFKFFYVADENHAAVYGVDPESTAMLKRGQVQNFVGITVNDSKMTVVTYEIDQNKNNAKPYIIDQFGIIKSTRS